MTGENPHLEDYEMLARMAEVETVDSETLQAAADAWDKLVAEREFNEAVVNDFNKLSE